MRLLFAGFILVYSIQLQAQLNENFDDNRNEWHVKGSDVCARKIENGKYYLTTFKEGHGQYTNMPAFFNANKDFVLEASFTQRSGSDNNGIGLYWGKGGELYNEFVFTTNGYYKFGFSDSTKWIETTLVKPMGQANELKVERKANVTSFYLNGKFLASGHLRDYGFVAGFINYTNMALELDYIRLIQNNPIALVENLPTGLKKQNLGAGINTEADEVSPFISTDGRQLYFGRKKYKGNVGGEADVEDIWVSTFDGTNWGPAVNAGPGINTANADNLSSVSADNNSMMFIRTGKFSYRKKTSSGWSELIDFGPTFTNEDQYEESQLSADGKILLFTVMNSKNLFYNSKVEEKDIYVSLKQGSSWSEPINLGADINTMGDETSPFLSADGRTLYFSSDGRRGYGSDDIFVSKRIGDGWTHWSEPKNMGPEINSKKFDAYYTLPASGEYAIIASSENSIGLTDIFSIQMPRAAKPNPVVLVMGKTLNAKTKNPVEAKIILDDLGSNKEVAEAQSDPNSGDYRTILPFGANYGLHAAAPGYLSVNENLELLNIHEYTEMTKDLFLVKIEVGETLQLNNVFFEQGRPVLKAESYPELDRLMKVMNENPKMQIELGGHTDNVGSASALMKLSQDRVEAVKKYLESKGISSSRITGKGYGATLPREKNDTEEHRKKNRRVEFKITKK